jgi:hypothetical protein
MRSYRILCAALVGLTLFGAVSTSSAQTDYYWDGRRWRPYRVQPPHQAVPNQPLRNQCSLWYPPGRDRERCVQERLNKGWR